MRAGLVHPMLLNNTPTRFALITWSSQHSRLGGEACTPEPLFKDLPYIPFFLGGHHKPLYLLQPLPVRFPATASRRSSSLTGISPPHFSNLRNLSARYSTSRTPLVRGEFFALPSIHFSQWWPSFDWLAAKFTSHLMTATLEE